MGMYTTHRSQRHELQRTIPRARYPTAQALRFLWNSPESFGKDKSFGNRPSAYSEDPVHASEIAVVLLIGQR